jgi:hypothetical protein
MMINAIVVSGMGEDATLPRMGCPVRFGRVFLLAQAIHNVTDVKKQD